MKAKPVRPTLIALVDTLDKLRPTPSGQLYTPEIQVTIATLNMEKNSPRNYRHESDHAPCAGGHFGRIFCGDKASSIYFSHYGPKISYGNEIEEYERPAAALKRLQRTLQSMNQTRGHTSCPIVQMGRWLEACGVNQVWMRPDGSTHENWLSKGEWMHEEIGAFLRRLERYMPEVEAEAVAQAA